VSASSQLPFSCICICTGLHFYLYFLFDRDAEFDGANGRLGSLHKRRAVQMGFLYLAGWVASPLFLGFTSSWRSARFGITVTNRNGRGASSILEGTGGEKKIFSRVQRNFGFLILFSNSYPIADEALIASMTTHRDPVEWTSR
jgi:hypothetical protein